MPLAVASEWQVKLLTDVLCHCIDKSRAATQIVEPRRRSVIEGLVREHLQSEGPLDLNAVWGAILHEPGVTERAMASAFAAMEDLEKALPVPLAPTQRLQSLNPVQRQALLGEAPIARTEIERLLRNARIEAQLAGARAPKIQTSLMPAIGGAPSLTSSVGGGQPRLTAALMSIPLLKGQEQKPDEPPARSEPADEATREARLRAARALLERASVEIQLEGVKGRSTQSSLDPGRRSTGLNEAIKPRASGLTEAVPGPKNGARPSAARSGAQKAQPGPGGKGKAEQSPGRGKQVAAAAAIFVVGLGVSGGFAWSLLHRDPLPAYDVSPITALRLSQGAALSADSVQAVIDDPRWSGMSQDARREAVLKVFKQLQTRGVHTLVLQGADASLQAQAKDDLPGSSAKDPLILIAKREAPR